MTEKAKKGDSKSKEKEQAKKAEESKLEASEANDSQEENVENKENTDTEDTGKIKDESGESDEASSTEAEETTEEDDNLEGKAAEWHDKYLRLSAEFDNYRRRTLKEKMELTKTANEDLLRAILPVVDDFERGIETIDKSEDLDALRDGVHLIYAKFGEFLKQSGIKEIEAKETDFDLDFHEALTKIPAPTEELKGKVVDVIEKGYTLNEKVIRYAKVVVGE